MKSSIFDKKLNIKIEIIAAIKIKIGYINKEAWVLTRYIIENKIGKHKAKPSKVALCTSVPDFMSCHATDFFACR